MRRHEAARRRVGRVQPRDEREGVPAEPVQVQVTRNDSTSLSITTRTRDGVQKNNQKITKKSSRDLDVRSAHPPRVPVDPRHDIPVRAVPPDPAAVIHHVADPFPEARHTGEHPILTRL